MKYRARHWKTLWFLFGLVGLMWSMNAAFLPAQPSVELEMKPESSEIYLGSDAQTLRFTARADGKNLEYAWELKGEGTLEAREDGQAVFICPESLQGKSAPITVQVTVTGPDGQSRTAQKRFTLFDSPPTGGLQVTVNAPDARIYINDQEAGTAQPGQSLDFQYVPVGQTVVSVEAEGYKGVSRTVTIKARETAKLRFDLKPAPASAEMSAESSPAPDAPSASATDKAPAEEAASEEAAAYTPPERETLGQETVKDILAESEAEPDEPPLPEPAPSSDESGEPAGQPDESATPASAESAADETEESAAPAPTPSEKAAEASSPEKADEKAAEASGPEKPDEKAARTEPSAEPSAAEADKPASAADQSTAIAELLAKAEYCFKQRYYTRPADNNAFMYYRQVLALDPENAQARQRLYQMLDIYQTWANSAYREGRIAKARRNYQRHQQIAEYLSTEFGEPEIETQYRRIRARLHTVRQVENWIRKGHQYQKQGKLVEPDEANALAAYRKVLAVDPRNLDARQRLYQILETFKQKGDAAYGKAAYDQAESAYQKYMKIARYLVGKFGDQDLETEAEKVRTQLQYLSLGQTLEGLRSQLSRQMEKYAQLRQMEGQDTEVSEAMTTVMDDIIETLKAIETQYEKVAADPEIQAKLQRVRESRSQMEAERSRRFGDKAKTDQ